MVSLVKIATHQTAVLKDLVTLLGPMTQIKSLYVPITGHMD